MPNHCANRLMNRTPCNPSDCVSISGCCHIKCPYYHPADHWCDWFQRQLQSHGNGHVALCDITHAQSADGQAIFAGDTVYVLNADGSVDRMFIKAICGALAYRGKDRHGFYGCNPNIAYVDKDSLPIEI